MIRMGLSTALRMPEPEIRHTTSAQLTRIIRFHVRTGEGSTDRLSVWCKAAARPIVDERACALVTEAETRSEDRGRLRSPGESRIARSPIYCVDFLSTICYPGEHTIIDGHRHANGSVLAPPPLRLAVANYNDAVFTFKKFGRLVAINS